MHSTCSGSSGAATCTTCAPDSFRSLFFDWFLAIVWWLQEKGFVLPRRGLRVRCSSERAPAARRASSSGIVPRSVGGPGGAPCDQRPVRHRAIGFGNGNDGVPLAPPLPGGPGCRVVCRRHPCGPPQGTIPIRIVVPSRREHNGGVRCGVVRGGVPVADGLGGA